MAAQPQQTKEEREHILDNLPEGTQRIQVIDPSGKQVYKKPREVDVAADEIVLSSDGTPIVMRGKPGRRPKNLNPVTPQIGEIAQARREHISDDPLRRESFKDAEGDGVINALILAMAEEAAAIEFEREEAGRHGQDTSAYSAKRARVLKAMADTWLKRKTSLSGGIIDIDSPAFKALFGFLLETFKDAMVETGVRPEHIETIFSKLVDSLDGHTWRQEAKTRMKDKLQ